jgi:hypothetical protein
MRFKRRPTAVFSSTLLFLVPAGCIVRVDDGGDGVRGSGVVKTERREVKAFSAISLVGLGTVKVKQTGRESLSISAEDNLLPLLECRVEHDTLTLGVAGNASLSATRPIEFLVEAESLHGLAIAGTGNVEAEGIDGQRLTVTITGTGNVTASGNVDALAVKISGTGDFHGGDLQARQADVHVAGVGHAVVRAAEELEVTLDGTGNVDYIGEPQVRQSISGVGHVRPR